MSRATQTRIRRLLTTFAVSSLAAGCVASGASAYLYAPSSGAGHGAVSSLGVPSITAATAGTGTVSLSWSAVTAPAGGTVSYYVSRDGGTPASGCPSASSPAAVTSCTDSGLPPGAHIYTVTAVWRSWTGRSPERSVPVATGVADHLVLAAATTTPTAGTADDLTITAKDSAGTTVTTYTGTKTLTFAGAASSGSNHPSVTNSSGSAVAFGTAEAISFTNGVASASAGRNGAMTLFRAETASVTVNDGAISSGTGLAFTVGAASAATFSLSTPAPTAGGSFAETITALDAYGNTATSYTGTKSMSFTGPGTSPGGKTPSYPSSVLYSAGIGTATVTLYDAQTTTLTAKQSFTTSGTSASFTVAPAATAALGVANPGSRTAGTAFPVTLSAIDSYGNVQPEYTGTRAVAFSGPASSPGGNAPLYPESVSFSEGTGTAQVTLYAAGSMSLKASDGTFAGTSTSFTVSAASAASLSPATPAPTAGTQFSETITAKDAFGNTASSFTGTKGVAFTGPASSPSGKSPSYPSSVSFTSGSASALITLYDAQTTTLSVTQGTLSATTGSFAVVPGSTGVFAWSAVGAQLAGGSFSATLTAQDAYGNLTPSYAGPKTLAFTGPETSPGGKSPSYPSSVSFTAGVGSATITLYDATDSVALSATQSTVKGTSASFAVSPLAASGLSLASPGPRTAGSAFSEAITAVDPYGNTDPGYEGARSLSFSGPSTSPSGKAPAYPSSVSFTAGTATASITPYDAQTTTLGVSDGSLTGTSASFTVAAAAASAFALSTPAPTAGTAFTETVAAKDAYGNTAAYEGSKSLLFSGPASSPSGKAPVYPSSVSFAGGSGTAQITLYDAQTTALTATLGGVSGTTATFAVLPASASVLSFASPATQVAGTPFALTLTVGDAYGNAVAYDGTKPVTFQGPGLSPAEKAPVYPATVTFAGGKGTAAVTLYNAAATTVEAAVSGGPKGTSSSFTVGPATALKSAWTGISSFTGSEEGLCLFSCTWGGFSKNRTWSSHVSVTDEFGNVASNIGSGHNVTLALAEGATGTLSTKTLTMPTSGSATTSSSVTYTSPNSNSWSGDSFTAQAAAFATATATVKR